MTENGYPKDFVEKTIRERGDRFYNGKNNLNNNIRGKKRYLSAQHQCPG